MTTQERAPENPTTAGATGDHRRLRPPVTALWGRMREAHPFRVRSGQDADPRHYHLRGPVGFPHETRDVGHR